MKAEIISIGDELLIGQVVNTNAAYLSRELNAIGISVRQVTSVGDDMQAILRTFRRSWKEYDVVIVTGGLGPTHDDISKAAVARFFGKELFLHAPTLRDVKARFRRYGYAKMPEVNIGQAMVPRDFKALRNDRGTAPGLLYQDSGKTFVILPGVPSEMEGLMTTQVIPILKRSYKADLEVIRHRTLLTTGIGESLLAERIGDPNTFLSEGMTLAYLPRNGSVRLRISAHGTDRKRVEREIDRVERYIRERAKSYIFGADQESLEFTVVELLKAHKKTLSCAESCTGGLIAQRVTNIPGSSEVFLGGVVSYDNTIKESLLGVKRSTLRKHGAVSEETAKEMAEGALRSLMTDFALSVTGIAGPSGGTSEKPVGLVWIGLAERGAPAIAKKFQFAGDRSMNRERAADSALELLRRRILEQE